MKKTLAVFFLLSIVFLGYIFSQKDRINSDIFTIINSEKSEIFKTLNTNLANEVNMLFGNEASLKTAINLARELAIFSDFLYKVDEIEGFKKELNRAKLALFKGKIDSEFLQNSLEQIYSPLNTRVLNVRDDFFSLSSSASIFLQSSNINIEPQTGLLKTKDGGFIYAKATLKNGYDDKLLLKFYNELKNKDVTISSGAIYAAFGKESGQIEGVKIGIIGTIISIVFLLLAFGNLKIFFVFLAPVFGLLSGLCACFLFLEDIHILSIVISTSLVGLMLDFSSSWLGLNMGKKIQSSSIKSVFRLFLLALFVTASGYLLFLLSPMQFLHQIAVFSVFALIGAFCVSYFLLPRLLDGTTFKQSKIFISFLNSIEQISLQIYKIFSKKTFWFILVFLSSVLIFVIFRSDFQDNIKNYSSQPTKLIEQSVKISQITGVANEFRLILAKPENQEHLLKELYQNSLINSHNSLYALINDEKTQQDIKDKLTTLFKDKQNLAMFDGFDIESEILKLEIIPQSDLKEFKILKNFSLFFDNPDIILLSKVQKNEKFNEILSRYNAQYFDLTTAVNENFTAVKANTLVIKIYAFLLAFIMLWICLNFKKALVVIGVTFVSAVMTLGLFCIFDDMNIFVIFGTILASAVGVDYLLFAYKNGEARGRIFGIVVACTTSMITFLVLMLSSTHAVFSFGASVSFAIFLNMLFACALTHQKPR
ncbi:hypothetical protein [Campylobacter suis]|uniref:Membrane protein, exporter n=1 Tax=Campylobacter suis TaxID=2790657 RepID=A0ABN7K0U5_9BACT|nr:hypothetical protein [Campylobacter suis]CAD7286191.1 hypothetical protein LMG8286_00022 [Campylobacter suis]